MKKLFAFSMTIIILLTFSACSGSSSEQNEEIQNYKKQINKLETKIEQLEEMLSAYETSANVAVGDNTKIEQSSTQLSLTLGQTVTINDVIEFTLDSCSWETEILPGNTSGAYSYKGDKEDETFLVLRGTFTNLNGNSYRIDNIHESEILINGKYSFNIQIDAEEPDRTGFGYSAKPLQTVHFIVYSSISDSVKNSFENAEITLNILNDPERTKNFFDKDDKCKNVYIINLTNSGIVY